MLMTPTTPIVSLADLITYLGNRGDLSSQKRRDMISAIKTLARWLGEPPSSLPAKRASLRERLYGLNPVVLGVSERRIKNVRALLASALDLAQPVQRASKTPLTPEWQVLMNVANESRRKRAVYPFARFCSGRGIAPNGVDDAVSDLFLAYLENDTVLQKPREKHQEACRGWNKLAETYPAWPQTQLAVPRYRETWSLPWSAFPASLHDEALAYGDHLRVADPLAPMALRKPLKEPSIEARLNQVRWAASALVHKGHDPKSMTALAYLTEVSHVTDVLRFLLDRNGNQTSKFVSDMAYALLKLGEKYLDLPDDHVAELKDLASRVRVNLNGLTPKNQKCLQQVNDPVALGRFLRFPFDRFEATEKTKDPIGRPQAMDVQITVATVMLQYAPVRIGNLVSLHLDKHLNWSSSGDRLEVYIEGAEVKNGQDLSFEFPAHVSQIIRRYIEHYRPVLCRGTSNRHLFPGDNGNHKVAQNLSEQIRRRLEKHTGLTMTAHQFRHVMAKVHLDGNPGEYEIVRRLLAHKSIETTVRYYAGEEVRAAVRHYQEQIMKRTKESS